MSTSYQDWLSCLRIGDKVDILRTSWRREYVTRQIKAIKQLSTNNYEFEMADCNDGSRYIYHQSKPLPSDSLIQTHRNPYNQSYNKFIHFCKACKYKCIYNNSFIIHRFDKISKNYVDSYCESCYIKFKYQYLFTLITFYFNSHEMYKILDINILLLITKYSVEMTTKIECGYGICANAIELGAIQDKINSYDMIKLLPISIMKKEKKCIIPCKSCSKLSLKATQCKILHGSRYMIMSRYRYRNSLDNHPFCTKCDSEAIQCQGISCTHDRNTNNCWNGPFYNDGCAGCGNPWLCDCCASYKSFCGICGESPICNKCCKFGKWPNGRYRWRAICSACHDECHNVEGGPDKSLREKRFENKYSRNKKKK